MAEKVIVSNRRARRDYEILEAIEAGIELKGTEIKSLRGRRANLSDSFARVDKGEVFIYNLHISPYEFGNINNVDPLRVRKLLLHKNQILKLFQKTQLKGNTLIPLSIYFKKGLAKVELAVARGRRQFDKREAIRRKEAQRDIDSAIRRTQKNG